jgi:hypothetical protein
LLQVDTSVALKADKTTTTQLTEQLTSVQTSVAGGTRPLHLCDRWWPARRG